MITGTTEELTLKEYLQDAKGIAWDTCHKIYVLMDDEQMRLMREYEYDPLISSDEMSPSEMFKTITDWYDQSCSLRFVEAVTTTENEIEGYEAIIPQGWREDEDEDY